MICRTADEAWQAGWDAPCEHGLGPGDCPRCALTAEEIARLAILHRPYLQLTPPGATTAA
ncbi:hypothetical protein [Streptomyces sp.]|uniref:hypothetical protein n=1 Tax=Streptomyces sp. TaxID=1931 RepID=UPI002F3F8605